MTSAGLNIFHQRGITNRAIALPQLIAGDAIGSNKVEGIVEDKQFLAANVKGG